MRRILALVMILLAFQACQQSESTKYPEEIFTITPELASDLAGKIRNEVAVEITDGLELSLWASDTLVNDPVAISMDPNGKIYYTKGNRHLTSEFDIRGHPNWMTQSISFQTVEDRRDFLRETFTPGSEESERFIEDLNGDGVKSWEDLTVDKEEVWVVEDASGDGLADKTHLYLRDFHEEVTDLANGLEYFDDQVFIPVGPDMWRTTDTDGDEIADKVESIIHGFAVHIGFGSHGMSGAKIGPDGRIWWGIGDIASNVVDKEGKQWNYPNQGVIVRSELDGSNFEVYARGVRNTHEFDFDQYGNLITVDNDGDHQGERERLVFLISGSDSGWRINWQFGKYTDPKSNDYKVWMDERLHVPYWDGQAAYILPSIQNYVNGPTGFVYNPGSALAPEWYNHFFVAEFRGSAANSPIHAFTLKPKGASYELETTQEVVSGVLPTGIDFGPEGAMYFADWIEGWEVKNEGRIWKLDVPGGNNSAIRQETKTLIQTDFTRLDIAALDMHLGHQDMRVRQKAQFELAKRGDEGFEALKAAAAQTDNQLKRVHAFWGIGQMAREDLAHAEALIPYLGDNDPRIAEQAAKMLGDVSYADAGAQVVPLLQHEDMHVVLRATEALGRMGYTDALPQVVEMLRSNDDEDKWLRHAGAIALWRMDDDTALEALHADPSVAVRTAAVVALRRLQSPKVAVYLHDENPFVVTEAARAINDDFSIEEALPELAAVLKETRFEGEPLLRRAISAASRVGDNESADLLVAFAKRSTTPPAMRAEALAALSVWGEPSVFDRVDGRYRGPVTRDDAHVKEALDSDLQALLNDRNPEVQIAAAKASVGLELGDASTTLLRLLQTSPDPDVRLAALESLDGMQSESLVQALQVALTDKSSDVRSAALEIVPDAGISEENAVQLYQRILGSGSMEEKQAVYASLAGYKSPEAVNTLDGALDQLIAGNMPPEVQLDVIEAAELQGDAGLKAKVKSYQDAKPADDPLAMYRETLAGGDPRVGGRIFYRNAEAQCVRCHSIFEQGGNAGPGLVDVGHRLTPEQLLESLVNPSAKLSLGYGVAILELNDGETVSGIVQDETDSNIKLSIGKSDIRTIDKTKIAKRQDIPSAMPPMGDILSKHEIRDMVAFLMSLQGEEG